MKILLFFLSLISATFPLFGQSLNITTASNGSIAVFPITPHSRVSDVISMFDVLFNPANTVFSSTPLPSFYQIALQTTRNGLLVNVLSIAPATPAASSGVPTLSTMLLVTYYPRGGRNPPSTTLQYAVIPIEQVVELIFSNTMISTSSQFGSTVPGGILPIFSVDMQQRALDIQNSFQYLNTIPNASTNASVGLQTTMTGPFYSDLVVNGLIPNIVSISLTQAPNGTLLFVTYQKTPPRQQKSPNQYYIVVSPEQVYGVVYFSGQN